MRAAHGAPSDVRLPGNDVRALFAPDARRQRYLDVEAALALMSATESAIAEEMVRQAAARTREAISARTLA